MGAILHHRREGFLKLLVLAAFIAVLLGPPAPAWADVLVVGALRDQDGAVVAGARVEALDAAGSVVARDRSAADGTFALATPARPASLKVVAADADPLSLAVPPPGTPVAAIVRRHRAADTVPSVADVAALPAASLPEIAAVIPYRIALEGAISDRWLSRGRGVTTVEGITFYRRGDGADTSTLLPDGALGGIAVRDPLQGLWYGDRAGGGIVDGLLFDRLDAARLTTRDGSILTGRNPLLFAASSWDPEGTRRLLAARGDAVLGPVSATVTALTGSAPGTTYAGVGTVMRASTRVIDLGARVDLTRDADLLFGEPNVGSVASFVLDAAGRSADAIAVRARWRSERAGIGGLDTSRRDGALVFGTTRGTVARVSAAVSFAYGDQRGYDVTTQSATALLPSISFDAPAGHDLRFHAGYGVSTLGTPGYAIARATLGELGLEYSDHRRLRAHLTAYAERDDVAAFTRGIGASVGWEVAPRVSVRAWSLRSGDVELVPGTAYPGGPPATIAFGSTFQRDVVWLTWDAAARFDVLLRTGALEGNVRVPLGARYALTGGTSHGALNRRRAWVGLTAR